MILPEDDIEVPMTSRKNSELKELKQISEALTLVVQQGHEEIMKALEDMKEEHVEWKQSTKEDLRKCHEELKKSVGQRQNALKENELQQSKDGQQKALSEMQRG